MFGIAWGVGSLLLLVGVGEGFRSGKQRELAEFGRDIIVLFPGRAPALNGQHDSRRPYLLTYQDYGISARRPHTSALPALYFPAPNCIKGQRIRRRRRNPGRGAPLNG